MIALDSRGGPGLFFYKGDIVDAYNFDADELSIVGIARALSRINRFTGNGSKPYSVAQHSVTLSYLVPKKLAKAALMHDVCEVFIGDVPSPVKKICPQLMEIEEKILRRLAHVFKIPYVQFIELRPFDSQIGRDEARALFEEPGIDISGGGFGVEIVPVDAKQAEDDFVRRFFELFIEGHDND
jgi:hypothetical protein